MIDRRMLLTGLAAAPLAGATVGCATRPAGSGRALKLVCFNIWHNQGDWPARERLLIDAIRAENPDVIALQEVLQDAAVGLPNQARTIADALGGYEMHFVSTDPEGSPRRYGNAILSRLPVLAHDSKKLEPLTDYRTAIRARVSVGGRPVDIVNTHLAWKPEQAPMRAQQIADLMAWLPQDGTPLIVMGDFNAVQEDAGLNALTGARFFSALPRGAAETTLNPAKGHQPRVIDHIFAEAAHFAPGDASVIGATPVDGEYPSDHFGVAATVRLR
ncbi:endonuclease/exonuclease/phosphatase family protein [Roseibacterium beibuensis]|uniref:endonuclease/exonuclease/phosphatase family protein n=1 Tax=[Roseibacterium] beibuensis TaxID=1193142 RepID=UPI00217DD2C7|nr:endonuclease/exonuclease/phosphatase family protein [Roseibacterium beibuensis]MCS6625001.1 endonuclease/exonuclease/phosphatase family protein [Roseibacterium beibuensis]